MSLEIKPYSPAFTGAPKMEMPHKGVMKKNK